MQTTNLQKVRGSVMLAVPQAILDELGLRVGALVVMTVEGGRLVVEPQRQRRLHELLAKCDTTAPESQEDTLWAAGNPAGREII